MAFIRPRRKKLGSTLRTVDPVDPVQIEKNIPFLNNQRAANAVVITVPEQKKVSYRVCFRKCNISNGPGRNVRIYHLNSRRRPSLRLAAYLPTFYNNQPRKILDQNNDITIFGKSVSRIYADKNTDVFFGMTRNPATGAAPNTFVTISGYFVPQP